MSVHWSEENSRNVFPKTYFHDRFSRSSGESGLAGCSGSGAALSLRFFSAVSVLISRS